MADKNYRTPFKEWITQPQSLIGLSAVLLSICGLFISFYEASLFRQEQHASVWPHVEVTSSLNPGSVKIFVQNTGIGPARIQTATAFHNGKVQARWQNMMLDVGGDSIHYNAYQSLINGRVLPPNSSRELIFAITADSGKTDRTLVKKVKDEIQLENLDVQLCYCSVYNQCWTTHMKDFIKRGKGKEVPSQNQREVESCAKIAKSGI